MSTLVKEELAAGTRAAGVLGLFVRILRWYRQAVTDPATECEKADWQRNSF